MSLLCYRHKCREHTLPCQQTGIIIKINLPPEGVEN
nr:MAG TPA: hypothetical protein [Caudoviricetes sp.]